ncbi:MAG: 50S ribosomal protein P1 [Candidatus Woesearchaeota archaeon]|nr:MAG: 50S ribosomal protein P1 [Candidatus Woesearchaeota archaeon]
METIYAAMLLHKVGKKVTEADMEKVLKAAGSKADKSQIKATVAALKNVDIDKAIAEAPVVAAPQAPAAKEAAPAAEKPAEGKKEEKEKKEEKTEEDKAKEEEKAAEGLGALFG